MYKISQTKIKGRYMVENWQFIGLFLLLSPIFPAAPIIANWVLGPKKPNPIKTQTYECGIETVGDTWIQFKVQYYIYAIVFVVFDVEALFLFPVAVAYDRIDMFRCRRNRSVHCLTDRRPSLRMEQRCARIFLDRSNNSKH